MNNKSKQNPQQEKNRKFVIKLITLLFPLIILLLLEASLRIFSYGDKLKLFISNPRPGYEDFMILNPHVGKKYFQLFSHDIPANDIFLRKKAEGSFRVFVMGSSTVLGFPYGDNLMFSRILHHRLEEAFPHLKIEVVNTAITAINSFTLADYARQVAAYDPDAVLIYAGHNEFYGAFGAGSKEGVSGSPLLIRTHLTLMNLRIYQLLRSLTASIIGKVRGDDSDQVKGTLMKRIVADQSIGLNSESYTKAMKRYRLNMEFLLSTFSKEKVPVFLSQVISNVKDIKPLSASSSGQEDEALKTYNRARLEYNKGNYKQARELFYEAKDLDGVRFRASEEVNKILHELALEYKTYEVPMISYFEEKSKGGVIGGELLTEHVHPNIDGYFVMADAFFKTILNSGLMGEFEKGNIHSSQYHRQNWGYTALDSLRAHHMVSNLLTYWPFVSSHTRVNDYRLVYRPKSKMDSLAFRVFVNPKTDITQVRLQLAQEYEQAGNLPAAYGEHEAILRTNPYVAINYRDAATLLIKLGDLPRALKYFEKSLEFESSFYANFRIAEIYLIKADYASARRYFQKAFPLAEDEHQQTSTMGKIYMCCVYGGQHKDAQDMAQQLQKHSASQYLKIPKKAYTYLDYIPFKTRSQIDDALEKIAEGRTEDAGKILEASLEVYDSHVARRYLGEIYLMQGKVLEADEQFQRIYDEFRFDPAFLNMYNTITK